MVQSPTSQNTVFCTYFDKGYLLKGLALHESLIRYTPGVKLWILTFDRYCERLLKKMNLKNVKVVFIGEIENKKLLSAKKTRNKVEYMWTTTPSWVLYVLRKSKADYAVYLDADLYFFSDVMQGVREIGNRSLLAVEHRYPKGRESLVDDDGRFNVAFNVFKRDIVGTKCLKRWEGQCIKWCYWRLEDGKMGDQLYLNEWPKLYGKNMVISKNIGVNVAPWNVGQYRVSKNGSKVLIDKTLLVCYHFHQFQILGPKLFSRVLGYLLSGDVVRFIYHPYEQEIKTQYLKAREVDANYKIEKTEADKKEIFRHKMARYIGPYYWGLKTLIKNAKIRFNK